MTNDVFILYSLSCWTCFSIYFSISSTQSYV